MRWLGRVEGPAFRHVPLGYGFAWIGHFLLEKNTPATFGRPFWLLISDFRMLGQMITDRGPRLGTSES